MKTEKVLIIGIDGLEPSLIQHLIDLGKSRGFSILFENGSYALLKSSLPPDTFLAWPSIYTGLIPQRLGLTSDHADPRDLKELNFLVRRKIIGRTFWDLVSKKNRKVCVINPLFSYPPWKVNGIMVVGPSLGLAGPTLSFPPREELKHYKLGTYDRIPLLPHEYNQVLNEAIGRTKEVFTLAYKLFTEDNYDLMFVADYTLDNIEHHYWSFYDASSSSNSKILNKYKNVIIDYYKLLDFLIYYFILKFSDEYTIIVLGDHGHEKRPSRLLSIERILHSRLSFKYSLLEISKYLATLFTYYAGIDKLSYWIVRKLQTRGFIKKLLPREEHYKDKKYIKIIKTYGIKEFIGLKLPIKPTKDLMVRIKNILIESGIAEDVISPYEYYNVGEDVEFEADLFIKLKGYGTLPSSKAFTVIPNFTRRIKFGSHAMYSVFFTYNSKKKILLRSSIIGTQDVTPTILDLMRVNVNETFDGRSVFLHE
jgi:predicted AlkP superfamily phosphohydrolase/phosphomutase